MKPKQSADTTGNRENTQADTTLIYLLLNREATHIEDMNKKIVTLLLFFARNK